MKILLTGGSGFIGGNVKEYLQQRGYDLCAPSSRELDCLDEESVKRHLQTHYYDVVLHFAYHFDTDIGRVLSYNLRIFDNMAKYSNLYGKMINIGSGAEYDKRFPMQMVRETDLQQRSLPADVYGWLKYITNQIIETSDNIYNLRVFGIFGKYENWKLRYISNLCCKSLKGLPLSLRQNCYFDYLWIDDFCRMLEKFMQIECPSYHVYNAVRGEKIDLLSLAHIVNEVADEEREIIVCKEGYGNEYTANNDRVMQEIGGMTYTDMKSSVSQLYKWYKEHQDEIDIESLIYE